MLDELLNTLISFLIERFSSFEAFLINNWDWSFQIISFYSYCSYTVAWLASFLWNARKTNCSIIVFSLLTNIIITAVDFWSSFETCEVNLRVTHCVMHFHLYTQIFKTRDSYTCKWQGENHYLKSYHNPAKVLCHYGREHGQRFFLIYIFGATTG